MHWIEERAEKYRDFLGLGSSVAMVPPNAEQFELNPSISENLKHFNIEWHFIPSAEALPFDNAYLAKFYPTASHLSAKIQRNDKSVREHLINGHKRQQGYIVGIETTQKPGYLPKNRQFYGTRYGHDPSADPLAAYMGLAGMTNGTRYDQTYPIMRKFFDLLNEDWRRKSLLPDGYRVTICPPAIFNLIGTVFHPDWSETETLELGFYRDVRGNATCFAVGANAPGDFSFIEIVEGEEWSLTGFRLALMPDQTRYNAQ
jgi:hypothetical protein